MTLAGSSRVFSQDGVILVSGWVDRPAQITVNATAAVTHTDPGGRTSFDLEILLDPGEHEIQVLAEDSSGNQATESLDVVVDPDLEEELAYLEEFDPESETLVADYVQWLTGDEAVTAA